MLLVNKLIIRIPLGLKTPYDTDFNRGMFIADNPLEPKGYDRLVVPVFPEDYNAPNPITKEVVQGYTRAFVEKNVRFYEFNATCKDGRPARAYALRDLLAVGGNLALYGVTEELPPCNEPLIAIEDYHRLDSPTDYDEGFTLRIGVLDIEDLKGSWRSRNSSDNYNKGIRLIFTHTHRLFDEQIVSYVPPF